MEEHVLFNIHTIYDGHVNVTYRSVSASRCPFDYVIYQMLLSRLKPDLVIEIGTQYGGSALYLADLLEKNGGGSVHTIDIVDRAEILVREHPKIKRFLSGWQGYDVQEAKGFNRILIIEDSSHKYEDSLGALRKFAPLVSLGSYFIVEDSIIDTLGRSDEFNGGPLRAIREFLSDDASGKFEIDRYWCDFFGKNATFNVNGYLKRVKED